ncbi:hypothetical protein AKJ44_00870 [candidate division MSBL1 archaeon SCGC-AAA261F17]|uniref:KEOPS complex subunit n=4 Tax=candidate division MSBL1 TaxID=215777 RepID=A0A133V278_9EURY|nr:hypothetical protein AKJ42_00240 [candidate division MSBL1 archaeon SCGC-AAA261C02]KXB02317.1 hypothetical protein AKJ44_00870 [candidate division MSBL1 archaeon SCGC-AAA261F17]KXB03491.1 hypothetical protein AKJ47_02165 [candidate division MSBL1 archaeon SCGC-AAA261G05]KXB09178.1 hypothetical protein AKJ46_00810 [candidate division MSBL1 archaeon SCGC-AAA833K04]
MGSKARISCVYDDESISQTISSSLEPDNIQAPENVKIKTTRDGNKVITEIEVDGRIETLLATLEDLLSCTSTAEKVI